ncbi:DegQ family serine endoprotease [Sinimarinibacterium sp. NLF-5-8]|uniref:DegQ family serine endoprotease n=1 Tax=Sinimarinibacterium sp. NLF-5-8 TaxID=2698684 RepID=UPI00137BFDB8|nr:DegQ family serine endoprotease [Sinimarinibacterium sp. NLF-5-8]QHS09759.1 DegQ family serine endoprotease [Sinimarinibacterium sp. NLF-5-8]
MTKQFAIKVFAPLAVSASLLTSAFMLSGAPPPAHADLPLVAPVTLQGVPSLAPMLKQVMPGVVNISVTGEAEVQSNLGPFMDDPFFRRFFGVPDTPQEREFQSVGSGVVVDAKKGYILTNNHVVENAKKLKVRLNDDREFDATLVGRDAETDIAVLKVEADHLDAVPMGDSDALEVGDFVVAIGSPFNLRQTVTSGIVSALGRTGVSSNYGGFIQTDASINPGNSGGALVDLRGQLVGIPSMIYSRSGGNIGIGFAIPVNLAKGIMAQLVEHGEVQRGRIGIMGQPLTPELAQAFGLKDTRGAVVTRVLPGSPAEKAGLKSEDIITEANGKVIADFFQLRNIVGLLRVGDKVDLKVLRDGKAKKISVTVGKDDEAAAAGDDLHPRLAGASFAPVDDGTRSENGDSGIIVQDIQPNSPAARSGLRKGDVIVSVNRKAVTTMDQFRKQAQGKGQLLLHIRRGSGAMFLLLQ